MSQDIARGRSKCFPFFILRRPVRDRAILCRWLLRRILRHSCAAFCAACRPLKVIVSRLTIAVASEADFQSIPRHGVATEDASECPEGDSEGTQEEWSLSVIGESDHVEHQKRGIADRKSVWESMSRSHSSCCQGRQIVELPRGLWPPLMVMVHLRR